MAPLQGVILANDPGKSLYPLTEGVHKPLLQVGNKPLIAYALEAMLRFQPTTVVVVVSPANRATVKNYVQRVFQSERRTAITCFAAEEGGQSAQALAQLHAAGLLVGETLVMAGDVISECDLYALVDSHLRSDSDITIALHEQPGSPTLLFSDSSSGHLLKLATAEDLCARGARFGAAAQRHHPQILLEGGLDLAHVFVFGRRAFGLIAHLAPRAPRLAQDVLPLLLEQQFSAVLMRRTGEARRLAVRAFRFSGFHRRVDSLHDFLQLNVESVRGLGGAGALRATPNNSALPDTLPHDAVAMLSAGCTVLSPELVVGSLVRENSQIGAGTKCTNSLVLNSASIGVNCLIRNSIIGACVRVGAGSTIIDSTLGDGLVLRDNSALDSETLAKAHAEP